MRRGLLISLLVLGLLGLGGLSFLMGSGWGQGAVWASAIYGVLITIFLAMQIWGFVLSQVTYSDDVEDAKYDMLAGEGILEFEARDEAL